TITVNKAEAKVGEEIEISFKATIPTNWYMYGSSFKVDGPLKTEDSFSEISGFEVLNKELVEVHPKKKVDDIWGGEITYFIEKAQFTQKLKVTGEGGKIV